MQAFLAENAKELLDWFLPNGALRKQFQNDHPQEKREMAEYAVGKFLTPVQPVRCFIQASTMAIHLGYAIAGSNLVPAG